MKIFYKHSGFKKMKRFITIFFVAIIFSYSATAQHYLLNAGPMLGYSEMKEVLIWVQTKNSAQVTIRYTNLKNNKDQHWTNTVVTQKETAFTAHLLVDSVEPGNKYSYELFINQELVKFEYPTYFQTQVFWEHRTFPPDFSFAAGSGAYFNEPLFDYVGEPYGGDYQIYNNIANKTPDFMLWLGDNVYLRGPDWNSKTGIFHRYTHDRATPELQKLLRTVHNYAILDDHDFGPNDSDRSFWNKEQTMNAFQLFWANPSYGIGEAKGAITFFQWADADFFLLDNRYNRTPNFLNEENKTMLGEEQLNWLKDALVYSKATYKFVVMGGQFLTLATNFETYSNYGFANERQDMINFIYQNNIKGVIFITGDRHHSEYNILKNTGKPTIFDITVSPLTSSPAQTNSDINSLRIENSYIRERNFAIFEVSGKDENRFLKFTFFNSDGVEIVSYSILNSDM